MRSATIQIKISSEEKNELNTKAVQAGMNLSEFIRTTALSDEKVIFLTDGAKVGKELAEINHKLHLVLSGHSTIIESEQTIVEKLDYVLDLIADIEEKIALN